ncbi:MAG: hypothetical protein PHN18_10625 [Sulfurospirillaceae bacterium]|nr:hypothetical protein [Sulfurospirillaceae bacterium]MDD2827405.1 hypothetical protein [Sulfurospirillaceae bacterium]
MDKSQQNIKAFNEKVNTMEVKHIGILWQFEEELIVARQKGLTYKQLAEVVSQITGKIISARAVNYYVAKRLKNKKNLYKKQKISNIVPDQSDQNRLEILRHKTQKRD